MRLPFALFNYQAYSPQLATELLALGWGSLRPWLSPLAVGVVAALCWAVVDHSLLLSWLAFSAVNGALGLLLRRRYQQISVMALQELRIGEWLALLHGGVLLGAIWGALGLLLVPGLANHNLMIVMIYMAVSVSAASIASFGLAHVLSASAVSLGLLLPPLHHTFPGHWGQLAVMFLFFHATIIQAVLVRHHGNARNLMLEQEKDRLLEQQRSAAESAQRANREKSAFLAAASHDLRQPLHALMLTSHALRMRVPEGESRDLVDRVLEAGQALSDQFNGLMDLSKLEGGAYRLNQQPTPLMELLPRAIASHRQIAEHKGLRLRLKVDRRLQRRALDTDPTLLGRAIHNLLDNAIKFSPAGRGVLLSARLRRGGVELAVQDQGIGIAAAEVGQVFKPYVQLHNPTRDRSQGIGLGLSIVQEAANLLGARLRLHSQPGRGSRFSLDLPEAALIALPARGATAAPVADAAPVLRLRDRHLLLVEDDPMAAAALQTWAGDWGLRISHRSNPADVEEALQPDLILCDVRLPGERDGIDWLTDWLAQWPEARGLLLSGELAAETHQRAEQEGLLLLTKPVPPDLLLRTLAGMAP
ncbi:ATP-binding response regulator [Solimonas sp. K1W22B-7]|uniref:ATP-binding response regulator n=1 Tax=Solimonas sp. K1W22B-7 TaxID=2303331 RepID=UPI0013C4AD95|nr:HAMP domain-containing sensor histidine kinase [Solimonas sp. K1W22B-7]